MRILIFNWKDIRHPEAGGAEVFTHEVAKRWVEWGHEVTLFCSSDARLSPEEVSDGVSIVRRGGKFTVYSEARRFYRDHGSKRFDVVVDQVNTVPFLAHRFVRDIPVIALIHQVCREIWWHQAPFPVAALGRFVLEPYWLRAYRDIPVITVSASSKASLTAYGITKIDVISEGMSVPDTLPFNFPKASQPTVVFVGRLSPNKRPGDALRAFALLRTRLPEAQMLVIGTGPLLDRLKTKCPSGVRFLGYVDQVKKWELVATAHVQWVPSVREGWGLVVSEAARVGTPSICYDVPGLRDSLNASGMGLLVPPSPRALAEATLQLIGDRKMFEENVASRSSQVQDMSWEKTAKEIEDCLVARLGVLVHE